MLKELSLHTETNAYPACIACQHVAMMHGTYPVSVSERYIPASDCAAEVVGVESDVHNFQIGDLVAPISDLNNIDGTEGETSALGGMEYAHDFLSFTQVLAELAYSAY
jgi:NADPH:quinone reductase-like Zn-dependent oxidoreductase